MQRPRQKFNFLLIPFFDNRCIPCTSTATMKYSWEMYINISSIFFFFLYFKRFLQFGCYFTHLFFIYFYVPKVFFKKCPLPSVRPYLISFYLFPFNLLTTLDAIWLIITSNSPPLFGFDQLKLSFSFLCFSHIYDLFSHHLSCKWYSVASFSVTTNS